MGNAKRRSVQSVLAWSVLLLLLTGVLWVSACRPSDKAGGIAPAPAPAPVGTRAASDEPPIRVKGGSLHLVTSKRNNSKWRKKISKKDWYLDSTGRQAKDISIFIDSADVSRCQLEATEIVTLVIGVADISTNSQQATVTFAVDNRHTEVTSTIDGDSQDDQSLDFTTGSPSYISSIYGTDKHGSKVVDCSFTTSTQAPASLFIFEW